MGSGAFFSEDYGAGAQKALKEDIWLSFWFIFAVSSVICVIIYPGMEFILRILQTPKELMALTREYVTVIFSGIIFVFLYNFFAYLLRAMGNSFIPLVFLAIILIIFSAIVKNQETMIELAKEQNEKLAELINKKNERFSDDF